jgi:hypothetical protein
MLGVDRARILEDFLVSNITFPQMPLKAGQLEPIFALIDDHGGIDGFMREVLLLEPAVMEAIREDLLEAPAHD